MAGEKKTASDFVVMVFEDEKGSPALAFINGYWALKRGTMKPYARATASWPCPRCYRKQGYRILFFPRGPASYPAPKIIEREILRQSVLRAQDEGWVEDFREFMDETGVETGAKKPRKDEGDE